MLLAMVNFASLSKHKQMQVILDCHRKLLDNYIIISRLVDALLTVSHTTPACLIIVITVHVMSIKPGTVQPMPHSSNLRQAEQFYALLKLVLIDNIHCVAIIISHEGGRCSPVFQCHLHFQMSMKRRIKQNLKVRGIL